MDALRSFSVDCSANQALHPKLTCWRGEGTGTGTTTPTTEGLNDLFSTSPPFRAIITYTDHMGSHTTDPLAFVSKDELVFTLENQVQIIVSPEPGQPASVEMQGRRHPVTQLSVRSYDKNAE
jgi:hypothetical protein